ncbi:MAG: GDSL-type esterase/lipase family protein [Armatimonadota bacterium]
MPDVVVINEGTNDAGYPDDVVREDYAELIAEVREAYPSAAILCMRPLAGTKAEAIRAAVQMASAFDPLVLYVDTTNWLRAADFLDDVHPNLAGHVRAAVLLASVIREVLDKYRMIAW